MSDMSVPLLSICIATFTRAACIARTLDSIIAQLVDGVEVVILDGNSPDETEAIVKEYERQTSAIRYFREGTNSGVDADYDKAVYRARGKFCWLMTDDDLLLPGAVEKLLARLLLEPEVDACILNAEVRDAELVFELQPRLLLIESDRRYGEGESAQVFTDLGRHLKFIGAVVVRREFWMGRDRGRYYGSLFIHVGAMFQSPPIENVIVIAEPLISIRYGNAMWTARGFEIWMFIWPKLVWSFESFSGQERRSVSLREPWRKIPKLGMHRATGGYSVDEYRRYFGKNLPVHRRLVPFVIAVLPARFVNALASVYCVILFKSARLNLYDLKNSRYSNLVTRLAARIVGI